MLQDLGQKEGIPVKKKRDRFELPTKNIAHIYGS